MSTDYILQHVLIKKIGALEKRAPHFYPRNVLRSGTWHWERAEHELPCERLCAALDGNTHARSRRNVEEYFLRKRLCARKRKREPTSIRPHLKRANDVTNHDALSCCGRIIHH